MPRFPTFSTSNLVFRMPNFQFSTLDASLFFSARASLHNPLHKVPKSKRVGRMSSFRFRQLLFSKKTVSSPPSWRPRENSTGNFWYPRVPRFISFSVAAFVFSVATRRGETYIGVLVPYCLVFQAATWRRPLRIRFETFCAIGCHDFIDIFALSFYLLALSGSFPLSGLCYSVLEKSRAGNNNSSRLFLSPKIYQGEMSWHFYYF